jgi:hypothetical protein
LRENFDRFNFAIHKEKEMADFRRVAPASAQTTTGHNLVCNASASVTPDLRHEGLDELTGDIVLSCVGGTGSSPQAPGVPIPQGNITVNLSAPFTSRLLSGSISEALLLIDDPAPGNQDVCNYPINPTLACQVLGDNGATFNTPTKFNTFQGLSSSLPGNQGLVTFLGIPIDPPQSASVPRTYRITNLRINATGVANLQTVFAFIASSSSTSMEINTPQQAVGVVTNGMTSTISSANPNFLQCQTYGQTTAGTINFTEDFATAFKVRTYQGPLQSAGPGDIVQNVPGFVYNSESGLEVSTAVGETGSATTGTRLQATISNIPLGVSLWTDNWARSSAAICPSASGPCAGLTGYLESDATLVTSSGTPVDPETDTVTQITDGTETSATVVWEITNTNSSAIDSLTFNVYAAFTGAPGNPGSPTPTGVEATALASFNPLVASWANGPVPEFSTTVNVPTSATNLFQVALCQTILLFPYVTDFYGFDTGIAISNTSTDPLGAGIGASPQQGSCAVNFYGTGNTNLGSSGQYSSTTDSNLTNGVINSGTTWAFALSTIDPGYNSTATYGLVGYAIAVCNFQYAHGYSFVSDTGIRNFAAAYLALIIPDAPRAPQPFTCSANGGSCTGQTGEQLVH